MLDGASLLDRPRFERIRSTVGVVVNGGSFRGRMIQSIKGDGKNHVLKLVGKQRLRASAQ